MIKSALAGDRWKQSPAAKNSARRSYCSLINEFDL